MKSAKIDPDNLFQKWLAYLYKQSTRYDYDARGEHLEHLFELFISHGVTMDDAEIYKREAVKNLTHEEGIKKNPKKLKDWVSNSEADYKRIMNDMYIEDVQPVSKKKLGYEPNADIMTWINRKFDVNVHPLVIQDAHDTRSSLYSLFVKDFYDRKPRSK
jgi:hypothetical protein